jgi:hypothetical protein
MSHKPKRSRPGFTRIELLVAAAMGLLLAANAAPAVMQAREAAQRTQCKNNLKQLALALHNYNEVCGSFPPGYVVKNWDSSSQRGFGWMSFLLPYLDQAPVYNRLNFSAGSFMDVVQTPDQKPVVMTLVPQYRCPTDVLPGLNDRRGGWPTSNYSGNAGHLPFPRMAAGIVTDFWPGQIPSPHNNATRSGLFGPNSNLRFRDITDGLSNTFMVGERGVTSLGGIWPGITSATHENDALTDTSHLSRPNAGLTSFSSSHQDGLHIGLCDGSVRWIEDSIDSQPTDDPQQPKGLYQRLGCRNDDQVVSGDF